jgi:hypothetical protein
MQCLQRKWSPVRVLFSSLSVVEVSVAHTFFRLRTTARPQIKRPSSNKRSSAQSTKERTSPTNLQEAGVTATYLREASTLEEMLLIWSEMELPQTSVTTTATNDSIYTAYIISIYKTYTS